MIVKGDDFKTIYPFSIGMPHSRSSFALARSLKKANKIIETEEMWCVWTNRFFFIISFNTSMRFVRLFVHSFRHRECVCLCVFVFFFLFMNNHYGTEWNRIDFYFHHGQLACLFACCLTDCQRICSNWIGLGECARAHTRVCMCDSVFIWLCVILCSIHKYNLLKFIPYLIKFTNFNVQYDFSKWISVRTTTKYMQQHLQRSPFNVTMTFLRNTH